ncbi:glycosyltransferase family 2 protein [Lacticaseibacillus daqingensis]|uniref:glycosyltransferase family 2 protein n=1 Tax=Lacticaseibacillus daqingensis TaxID=2486014 RepID=UPI000F7B9BFA|nr:glycosyltransferase family 2 protein [Lacticaseibacillus daqingensis]
MEKLLSIIMPFHQENEVQLKRILSSLNNQVEVPWAELELLLVGDGVAALPERVTSVVTQLPVQQLVYMPSRGAGVARQAGIDQTRGRYVMFLDADDVLADVFAVRDLLAAVRTATPELVIARYVTQFRRGAGFGYVTSSAQDGKAAYAKLFQRAFLVAKGLRWHPDLRLYEDTYFVGLACKLATDIVTVDRSVYVWLWNPASTVRQNGHAFNRQLHVWAQANRAVLRVLRVQAPVRWQGEFYNYCADLFFRQRRNVPADEVAFLLEQQRLLAANRTLWTTAGMAHIRRLIGQMAAPGGLHAGVATEGVTEFLAAQEQLLRQAFEAEQASAR